MTGKDSSEASVLSPSETATSEASVSSPSETAPEPAQVPTTESSGEVVASESMGQEQAPEPPKPDSQALDPKAPEASAMPETAKPEPPSEDVPSAPLQLTLEDVSQSSLTVSWEPPEKLGKLGLQGYVLELCREGASEWVPVNPRPAMVTQQTVRNLALGDKFFLRVTAVSSAGAGPAAVLDHPVHIQEIIEAPKIRVPRHLRQTYIRRVGESVNLQIPFQGKPKPQASWTHNGHALDSQRVNVRTGDQDSILFIRSAQRSDSGRYELTVRLEGLEAKANIDILVIEKPGPPSSIRLLDVWGCNAALEWTPPQDTGNTELLGYTVQKADKKTGQWFTVLERYHPTTCTISDLIIGNSYSFRVFSENLCGLSDAATTTKELAHIQKADITAKPKGFIERDFSEAPSFTQPLADHTSTPGYSTQLFCSVRASPKPKIIWMKNKMDIQGDPKYRAVSEQGVCTLEIRKPSPFDSGVYTCKAINVLGEASVDCRLEVKGEGLKVPLVSGHGGQLGHTPGLRRTLSARSCRPEDGALRTKMSLHGYPRPRHHRNMERPLVPAGPPPPEAGIQPDPGVGLAGLSMGFCGSECHGKILCYYAGRHCHHKESTNRKGPAIAQDSFQTCEHSGSCFLIHNVLP
ncbi:myosin-binding protein H [Arvicola amphibius]|uniref:myosin-binding protein H n=1 Tax=Arvicola amphibius TaxID=1047088 RepID=UPI001C0803B5|nr:myosin-binding protein H [Arvicola amphibius]